MEVKSEHFEVVKQYYDNHLWNLNRVRLAVTKKWITPDEYEEIVGEKYDAR